MREAPQSFWMVVGDGPASFRHPTRESAEAEARRLARLDTGTWFFVMEAISSHRKYDVESITLRPVVNGRQIDDSDLPF